MKRKYRDATPAVSVVISAGTFILSLLLCSLISALIASQLENSREGLGYLSLTTLLVSGVVGGFVSAKISQSMKRTVIVSFAVCLLLAVSALIGFGYSLGAFMNEMCFFLTSTVGARLGIERKRRRRYAR